MHQADSLIRGAGPLERQQIADIAASVGQVHSPQMFFLWGWMLDYQSGVLRNH